MGAKKRCIEPDGQWPDFHANADYKRALRSTAGFWVALVAEMVRQESDDSNLPMPAFKRATAALPQLPMEFDNNELRFERSRWRASTIHPGQAAHMHCEHPWSKRHTTRRLLDFTRRALADRVERDRLLESVATVLDARQDTVLLPTAKLSGLGILSDKHQDGLSDRYADALSNGLNLVDRKTGDRLSIADLIAIDSRVQQRIENALSAFPLENGS